MPPMATTLPMDTILFEILPRLPAKFLLRCKCVCKSWKTVISTPEFINLHLRHSLSSDSDSVLILSANHHCLYSHHLDSSFDSSVFKLSFPAGSHSFVVGSCNGLVCVGSHYHFESKSNDWMTIMNPSTGDCKQIALVDEPMWNSYEKFGFGFDCGCDDYKVVRIVDHVDEFVADVVEDEEDELTVKKREVRVYSFKAESWKNVEVTYPGDPISYNDDGVVMNDHLVHWKMWCSSERKLGIRCFDLRSERWTDDVPLPDGFSFENKGHELGILDGCLCLLGKRKRWTKHRFTVWVMKEYGV